MGIYIDCEYNGFRGQLISMALVNSLNSDEFYEVLEQPKDINPWVLENVIPFLNKKPITEENFKLKLCAYLIKNASYQIIYADWPEDICHLCNYIFWPEGKRPELEMVIRLIHTPGFNTTKHNALEDAKDLMSWHKLKLQEAKDLMPWHTQRQQENIIKKLNPLPENSRS